MEQINSFFLLLKTHRVQYCTLKNKIYDAPNDATKHTPKDQE